MGSYPNCLTAVEVTALVVSLIRTPRNEDTSINRTLLK